MLEAARKAGVTGIIATPHADARVRWEPIFRAYEQTLPEAEKRGIRLLLGCETHYSVLAEMSNLRIEDFTFGKRPVLLLHLSAQSQMAKWEYILSHLSQSGIRPIIAHPERSLYIQKSTAIISEMRGYGCEIQADASGFYAGPLSRESACARRLLREGLLDYIASDAHTPRDYAIFGKCMKRYAQYLVKGEKTFSAEEFA